MSGDGDLDFALARIAARRARRPGSAEWQRIDALREFVPALAAARTLGFGDWLSAIDAQADAHQIEAALRDAWHRALDTLSRWMPRRWRPALHCCADWIDLPRRRDATRVGTRAAADAAWETALRRTLDAAGADEDPAFARLGRLLLRDRRQFAALPPGNGGLQRAQLESSLLAFLHAAPPGPAVVFAWVALLALEHERLRGALVSRTAREAAA